MKSVFCIAIAFAIAVCSMAHGHDLGCNLQGQEDAPLAYSGGDPSGTLPVVYIETEGNAPVTSKEVYISGTYYIDCKGINGFNNIGSASEPLPLQIRGRGHSSWSSPKKPYKLKLGEKTSLFGMPKNKHWALLKPSENTVAGMQLGKIMGMEWTPSFQPVEVILNSDYIGLYFLTETIRIDDNRVNIWEQPDGETDPDKIGGGWLVEIDNYSDSNQITIRENDLWYMNIKYHSPEELSAQQKQWLTDEFTAMNAAIYSSDKRSREWEKYMDVESMARFFIVQELMDNPDGFHGSFYLHKDIGPDAHWVAGPLWDLVCYYREKTDYTFRLEVHYGFIPHWIGEIIQYDSFCRAVAKAWQEVYPSKLQKIYEHIDNTVLPLAQAWRRDTQRWNGNAEETAQVRADRLKYWIESNIEWLGSNLPQSPYASLAAPTLDTDLPCEIYNMQGILVNPLDSNPSFDSLAPGIYIIRSSNGLAKKVIVK